MSLGWRVGMGTYRDGYWKWTWMMEQDDGQNTEGGYRQGYGTPMHRYRLLCATRLEPHALDWDNKRDTRGSRAFEPDAERA